MPLSLQTQTSPSEASRHFHAALEKAGLVLVMPHGRAGSYFVQSLFDSHPEVVTFPYYFDRYGWDTAGQSLGQFFNSFFDRNPGLLTSRASILGDAAFTPKLFGENGNEHIEIDKASLRNSFFEILSHALGLSESSPAAAIDRKEFLVALHLALAEITGKEIEKVKYLLVHLHWYDNQSVEALSRDFSNAHFVAMVRDPREALGSGKSRIRRLHGESKIQQCLLWDLDYTLKTFEGFQRNYTKFKPRHVKVVDLNRLHREGEKAVYALADWLGIERHPVLAESTFLGKRWWGNSSNLKPIAGLSAKKDDSSWRNMLTSGEAFFIEHFTWDILKQLGHPRVRKRFPQFVGYLAMVFSTFRLEIPLPGWRAQVSEIVKRPDLENSMVRKVLSVASFSFQFAKMTVVASTRTKYKEAVSFGKRVRNWRDFEIHPSDIL